VTARFWQCLLLVEGALAALATMTISWLTTVPSIIAWIAYLMLLHALLVTATYASATAIDRANGRRDAFGAVLRGLRVIAQEFCALGWLQWRMAIEPYMRMHDPGGGRGRLTPVLLLHGVLCNRAVWSFIRRKLLAAGFGPVVAINLEPTLGSIDLQAVLAVRALEALQETCNFRPVIVIAHSMGGLVARAAMRSMTPEQISASIATLITIATPHRGSDMARLLPGIAPKQMVPGSTWLVELNQDRQSAMPVPVISIYSDDDNLVAPRDNARLPGTQALGLPGLGHFGMLMSNRVWRELCRALQPFAPRPL
jgi:predicted alpha/beta hydrolase family esterase